MPEDFHQPKAMEKPASPDDLKAISGIGPKLETVLNGLGIWTYEQIAGWSAAGDRLGRRLSVVQGADRARRLARAGEGAFVQYESAELTFRAPDGRPVTEFAG